MTEAAWQEHEAPLRLFVLDYFQPHPMSLRFFGRSLSGVALIDVG